MMKNNIFIGFIVALLLWACTQENAGKEVVKKVAVKTARPILRSISLPIHRSGVLAAASEYRLSFKIGGLIDRIPADEGDRVDKGTLLASLNLEEINAQVNLARSGQEKAARDLTRIEKLYRDSVATLEQKQDLQTAYDAAAANLRIALFNLKHAQIVAPENGLILKRFAGENELIAPGNPVFYFASTDQHWILRLGVTDYDIIRLQPGDSAAVNFDVYPDKIFTARVTEIAESGDPRSGTFEVELTLTDQTDLLTSGFVARATIFPSQGKNFLAIPVESLIEANTGNGYVFVVTESDSQVVKKAVALGPIVSDQVIIKSGLTTSDVIITSGAAYLTEKSIIKIIP